MQRLQLLPYKHQTLMLRAFIAKIVANDDAMASQLQSTSVRVVKETSVFKNPANAAEQVVVQEIECDHSCSWEAALELYQSHSSSAASLAGFFVPKRDPRAIFLVLPLDALRVRLCSPGRLYAGSMQSVALCRSCLRYPPSHIEDAKKLWRFRLDLFVKRGLHLETFALLNGSVFSIWHNVRNALDPRFDPAHRHTWGCDTQGRGRNGRVKGPEFTPNVKIQLLTTSDGKKLGGIRLSTVKPWVHGRSGPNCNKLHDHTAFCRRKECLTPGYSEVDKLIKSLSVNQRDLAA